MTRLIAGLFAFLVACAAFAQAVPAEAPVEHASMATVVVFLVLFIGGCVGFVGYLVWRGRKEES